MSIPNLCALSINALPINLLETAGIDAYLCRFTICKLAVLQDVSNMERGKQVTENRKLIARASPKKVRNGLARLIDITTVSSEILFW